MQMKGEIPQQKWVHPQVLYSDQQKISGEFGDYLSLLPAMPDELPHGSPVAGKPIIFLMP